MYSRYLTEEEMLSYSDYCEDVCWQLAADWYIVNPGHVRFEPNRMY